MPVADDKDRDINGSEQQVDDAVQEHEIDVCKGIFPGVGLTATGPVVRSGPDVAKIGEQDLQPDNDNIQRGADQNKYLFSEVFHDVKINEITHLYSGVLLTRSKSLYM